MQPIFEYLVNRMSEKSTWVSLGTALTGLGVALKPEQWQAIMFIGMGVGGLLTAFLPARVQEKNIAPSSEPTPLSVSTENKTS